jgi:Mn2+/Fe2+ NRAMP family transporter
MPKMTVILLSVIFFFGIWLKTSFYLKVWKRKGQEVNEKSYRIIGLIIWAIVTIAAYIMFNVLKLGIGGQF